MFSSLVDFVSETTALHVVMLIIVVLILINTQLYPVIFLSSALLVLLCCMLAVYGITLFALIILVIEVHVFYIIACLALTWYRFDTVKAQQLSSSRLLNKSGVLAALVAFIAYATCANSGIASLHYGDAYVYALSLYAVEPALEMYKIKTTSIMYLMMLSYTTVEAFEFFILNIIMLIAVVAFFNIHSSARREILRESGYSAKAVSSMLVSSSYIIRSQNQSTQHARQAATRCVNGSYDAGLWSVLKSNVINS